MTRIKWLLGAVVIAILVPAGLQNFLLYRKYQGQQLDRDRQLRKEQWLAAHPDGEMKGTLWFSPDGMIYSKNELPRVDAAGRRSTPKGIPYDEPITIKTGDAVFRVPAGYLMYWPQPEHVGKVVTREIDEHGIGIMVWFPSGRPLEIRKYPGMGPQPREYLRPRPAPDEFPMVVEFLRIVKADAYVSPSKAFENRRRLLSGASDKYGERFGLQWFRLEKDQADPRDDYRHIPGTQPQVIFSCTESSSSLPNPGCVGYVHFDADDLAFRFSFPRPMLPRWREALTTIRDLALTWRVEPRQQRATGQPRCGSGRKRSDRQQPCRRWPSAAGHPSRDNGENSRWRYYKGGLGAPSAP